MWSRALRFALTFLILLSTCYVRAQTITTTDNIGETVVEVVTTNTLSGGLTTQTIQTLTPNVNQGPVGQPGTTPTGQIVYYYTTTNAVGQTTVLQATFTPTFPATRVPSAPSSGTILQYSQWLSMVGTNTVTPSILSSRAGPSLLVDALKTTVVGGLAIVCGGLLVFI